MRVAILSESSADETALRVLVDALLGCQTLPVVPAVRRRGWPAVRDVLPAVVRALHYRSDAEGLVVVADANHSSVVQDSPENRLRELQAMAQTLTGELKPVAGRGRLQMAVGVASPCLEAWLLTKRHLEVNEAAWEKGLETGKYPYSRRELKRRLYGMERCSLQVEAERMVAAAGELCTDLGFVEKQFPIGFAELTGALRAWTRSAT